MGSRLWGTARSLVGSRCLCGMSQAPSDGSKVNRSILSYHVIRDNDQSITDEHLRCALSLASAE